MVVIVSSHVILAMVLMRPLVAVPMVVSVPWVVMINQLIVHTVLAVSVTGVVVFWELAQILIGILLLFIVQLNKQFSDTYIPKDHLRMTDHIFWIGVVGHFQFQTSHIRITAQGPKMCRMHSVDALNLLNLVITLWKFAV